MKSCWKTESEVKWYEVFGGSVGFGILEVIGVKGKFGGNGL